MPLQVVPRRHIVDVRDLSSTKEDAELGTSLPQLPVVALIAYERRIHSVSRFQWRRAWALFILYLLISTLSFLCCSLSLLTSFVFTHSCRWYFSAVDRMISVGEELLKDHCGDKR